MASNSPPPPVRRARHARGVALVALAGSLLSVGAALAVHRAESARLSLAFAEAAQVRCSAVDLAFRLQLEAGDSVRRLFDASEHVEPQEFAAFVREAVASRPGLEWVGWLPHDGEDEQGRPRETPALAYAEPSGRAGDRSVLAALPGLADALAHARDGARPEALSSAGTEGAPHLSFVLPVYRDGAPPHTVDARRRSLRGFVVLASDVAATVAHALHAVEPVATRPSEGAGPALHVVLGWRDGGREQLVPLPEAGLAPDGRPASRASDPARAQAAPALEHLVAGTGGRVRLSMRPHEAFVAERRSLLPWAVAVAGLLATLLLAESLRQLSRRCDVVQRLNLALAEEATERRRAMQAAVQARHAAEAADRAKSDFLANLSHELRTPLHGVLGLTELALEGADPAAAAHLAAVQRSARALLHVVDDMLDFSRLEQGRPVLAPAPFGLFALVEGAADLVRAPARERGLQLDLLLDPRLPPALVGDAARLRQVLTILLGNAVKFTPSGRIAVEAHAEEVGADSVRCRFLVRDTGIGIAPEHQNRIFERFTQVDESATRRHGGLGLGLAIARELVELMGGALTVESAPGQGATFSFVLELPVHEGELVAPEPEAASDTAPQRGDVLLVEDNPVNREIARRMLERLGCRVHLAEHGRQAVERFAGGRYELVLMDCQMPEMDGYAATRAIRRLERDGRPRTPIVALTAHAMPGDRERCLAAGMDDHVPKPVTLARLRALLALWCEPAPARATS